MKRMIARILCAVMLFNSLPLAAANAAVATTQQATSSERADIMNIIKREDVRAEFTRYGITPQEMEMKLASMSDEEIRYMHSQLEEALPAGQSAVGAIVGAAVLVFIILLITDLLGLTHVFDFVNR